MLKLSLGAFLLVASPLFALETSSQVTGWFEAAPSARSISAWESRSQSDPNNLDLRAQLLGYYAKNGPVEKYFSQALWIVQHHPESDAAGARTSAGLLIGNLSEADRALLKSAWEQAIVDQADSGKVLYNAGSFFIVREPVRAAHLFEQARQLEPENEEILTTEANLYVSAFDPNPMHPANPLDAFKSEDKQTLRGEITTASDPALLAEVGSRLIWMGQRFESSLKASGTELINRAISLEPTNQKWKDVLHRATLPAPPPPPPPPPPPAMPPLGTIRIGGKVAEANLIRKVDPAYPPLAVHARVSGMVEFTATIGENGHIENLQLVRGHPMLVNAAKEAVLQYMYKPTLMNGNPVSVITSVTVPFELPTQQ